MKVLCPEDHGCHRACVESLAEFLSAARVVGSVQTLDWRNASERGQACRLLSQHAQDSSQGPQAPLLIKHAVSHWPALQRWDLQYLTHAYANQR